MRAGENPEVLKLIARESASIARFSGTLPPAFPTSLEVIGALLAALSQRQRYFALIGEHFSVFGFDGIIAMDELDEALLRVAQEILRRRPAADVDASAEEAIVEEFAKLPALEKHPVGYMVLFMVRKMFEGFDDVLTRLGLDEDEARPPYEAEMLKRVALVVDSYVGSRRTPVVRHFSDLRREYWVVARMHCRCGQPKYEVKMQSLVTGPEGAHVDRLDVKCGACGDTQALEFPLPHFGDLSIA